MDIAGHWGTNKIICGSYKSKILVPPLKPAPFTVHSNKQRRVNETNKYKQTVHTKVCLLYKLWMRRKAEKSILFRIFRCFYFFILVFVFSHNWCKLLCAGYWNNKKKKKLPMQKKLHQFVIIMQLDMGDNIAYFLFNFFVGTNKVNWCCKRKFEWPKVRFSLCGCV